MDIVVTTVTLTGDMEPFLDASAMMPGAFMAVTDLARPWKQEGLASLDRIIVDDIEQERSTPYPMVKPDLIQGDLLSLVCGNAPGRESEEERNAFLFRGMAIGDLALAGLAYRKARENEKGSVIR